MTDSQVIHALRGIHFESLGSGEPDLSTIPNGWDYAYGSSKGVFLIPDYPYAVKYTFRDLPRDYCDIERKNYLCAVSQGIGEIVPYTDLLAVINDVAYYKQERVDYNSESIPEEMQKTIDAVTECVGRATVFRACRGFKERPEDIKWIACVIFLYGVPFFQQFKKWVIDNNINDLHTENTGYKNGLPVLLDFAGIDIDDF